jgi:predicted dinucleotide-binding enzyme
MKAIRVHIENGRISGDAPPGLLDGDVALVPADGDDEMTEAELARLNDALELGFEAIKAGGFRPAREAIADLRHRLR